MGKNLYVGNIPFRTTEEELRAHFGQAGPVGSVGIIVDRMTGQSRGFAFVEMATEEGAAKAVGDLHGADFGGRKLTVAEARPKGRGRRPSPRARDSAQAATGSGRSIVPL